MGLSWKIVDVAAWHGDKMLGPKIVDFAAWLPWHNEMMGLQTVGFAAWNNEILGLKIVDFVGRHNKILGPEMIDFVAGTIKFWALKL